MLALIRDWLDRRVIRRSRTTPAAWDTAFAALPVLAHLDAAQRHRLRELATLFLHRKSIEGAQGLAVTEHMALTIALQACLPVLALGLEWYEGWTSVIVYPAGFAPEREVMDEYGVVHRIREDLSGEAWEQGPVILAWDAVRDAGIIDGHNLVIHELAHKLDMRNGAANGYPPLHPDMDSAQWTAAFSSGFADFRRRCAQGGDTDIDPYAASSPAEFFAVLSEVFFERPDIVMHRYPAIYGELRLFYRQDPLARQINVISGIRLD